MIKWGVFIFLCILWACTDETRYPFLSSLLEIIIVGLLAYNMLDEVLVGGLL